MAEDLAPKLRLVDDVLEVIISVARLVRTTFLHYNLLLKILGLPEDHKIILANDIVFSVAVNAEIGQGLRLGW